MKFDGNIEVDSHTPSNPGYVYLQFNPVLGKFTVTAKPDGGSALSYNFDAATGRITSSNGFAITDGGNGPTYFRPYSSELSGAQNGSEIRSEYSPNFGSYAAVQLIARDASSAQYAEARLTASGEGNTRRVGVNAGELWPYYEMDGTRYGVLSQRWTKTVFGQDLFGTGNITAAGDTLTAIINGAARTIYNNCRTRPADSAILSSAPNMYSSLGVVTAFYPTAWTVNPSTDACVFAYSGGNPVYLGASDGVWFPSTTYNVSTGQADLFWRAETECDGQHIVFGVTSWAGEGPRFVVDGVYYSLTGMTNTSGIGAGAGTVYARLSFATAKKRRIIIEGRYDIKLVSVHTAANAACTRPADYDAPKMVFVGDSNAAMYWYDTKGDSYAMVLADCLGMRNAQMSAVSGTGLQATNSGANYNYVERLADVTGASNVGLVIVAMSWNDWNYGAGFTAPQIETAASTIISTIRAAHPSAIILFHGVNTWDIAPGDETGLDGHEAAVLAAVTDAADPLVGFIPVRSALASPILYGASATVGTHANRYVNTGIDHLTPDGNNYVGRWLADRVLDKLVELSGGKAPAILPPPAPAQPASTGGISIGAAIALRAVRY